mgnify:CR=1 FL=1
MSFVFQNKAIRLEGKRACYEVNIEKHESSASVVQETLKREITDGEFNDARERREPSFTGVQDYDEAIHLFRDGWRDGVDRLRKAIGQIQTSNIRAHVFKNDVQGFAPIVPHALLGLPQSMVSSAIVAKKTKTISILYDMTISCDNSPNVIVENGLKMLQVVVRLEQEGYRVELSALQSYADERSADCLMVKLKGANQFLDLKRIGFPVAHSAFFRVIGFDWYSRFPQGKYRSGYGSAFAYRRGEWFGSPSGFAKFIEDAFGRNSVYISGVDIQKNGINYIIETLKKGKAAWDKIGG